MGAHCIIPPSSAYRWVNCALSVQMGIYFPNYDDESESSAEGTAAHELAAIMVQAITRANLGTPTVEQTVGKPAANGVIFTEEMFEAAQLYAEDVAEVMRSSGVFSAPALRVEQKLHIKRVHETQFGTPDCSLFYLSGRTLYLWDFKFGYRIVEAFENWQLMNYVAGLLDVYSDGRHGLIDDSIRVVMRVVQPRAYHRDGPVREWSCKASELRGYINDLSTAADRALGPNPQAKAGTHCQHCPGRHACDTLKRSAYAAMDYVGASTPELMTAEACGVELRTLQRMKKIIESRTKGVEAHVEALLKRGDNVPFYALEMGKGRETWAKPLTEVFMLGDLLGKELRKPVAITPKQARDLGIDDAVIKAYSQIPETGIKLVPYNGNKAKQVFSK